MQTYEIAFYTSWLLIGGYVLSNRIIRHKIKAHEPAVYSKYLSLGTFDRTNFILSVLRGDNLDQEALDKIPGLTRMTFVSGLMCGTGMIALATFFALVLLS